MMDIFLDKVNVEISKAKEYVELNASKHPDVLRMLTESLQDSVRLLLIHSTTKKPPNEDFSKVLAGAQSMLQILKSTQDRADGEKKLARTSSPISVQFDRDEIPKFRGDSLIKQEPSEIATTKENICSVPSNEIQQCIFCLQNHCSEDCTVYTSVFHRKVRIDHLCGKRLQVKHPNKPRVNKFEKCEYCNEGSHNRILCPEKCRAITKKLYDELAAVSCEDPRPTLNEPMTGNDCLHRKTPLTLRTFIEEPKSGEKTSVRLVVDRGHMSLISKSAAARIGAKCDTNLKRSIFFHNKGGGYTGAVCVPAQILVHLPNAAPVLLEVQVVEEVCSKEVFAPTVAEFKNAHPHFAHVDFPDPGCDFPVEMQIGHSSKLGFVSWSHRKIGEKCPPLGLKSGWSLAWSRFGWLIAGTDTSNEAPVFFSDSIYK